MVSTETTAAQLMLLMKIAPRDPQDADSIWENALVLQS
jgi:hypothetical protein